MTAATYSVHADDELAPIRSGHRVVRAEVGRTWVRVFVSWRKNAVKVRRSTWDRLPKERLA